MIKYEQKLHEYQFDEYSSLSVYIISNLYVLTPISGIVIVQFWCVGKGFRESWFQIRSELAAITPGRIIVRSSGRNSRGWRGIPSFTFLQTSWSRRALAVRRIMSSWSVWKALGGFEGLLELLLKYHGSQSAHWLQRTKHYLSCCFWVSPYCAPTWSEFRIWKLSTELLDDQLNKPGDPKSDEQVRTKPCEQLWTYLMSFPCETVCESNGTASCAWNWR